MKMLEDRNVRKLENGEEKRAYKPLKWHRMKLVLVNLLGYSIKV